MPACYTDRLSVRPGQGFALHASSASPNCRLEIARVGAAREVVLSRDVVVGDHPTPPEADRNGCGWPAAAEITVGADWRSGYYDIVLTDPAGEAAHHFVCVRPPTGAPGARAVMVLTTNTLHAYNYWGGRSAYCDVEALMGRRLRLPEAMAGALGVLSTQRPFPPLLLAPPADMPRLVNLRKRGFEEPSWAGADPAWSRAHGQSPYDGSAGYPEQVGARLRPLGRGTGDRARLSDRLRPGRRSGGAGPLRRRGPGRPQRILVGAAAGCDRRASSTRGGRLAIFSGNTAFWKVRWEDGGRTMICHKWQGFEADPAAKADPAVGTHLWSHPAFGRPEAQDHRPQLHLRRLPSPGPVRRARPGRLHRLPRQALGAGGLRPLLR